MSRKKKHADLPALLDEHAGESPNKGLPVEVASYLSHIRALVVAGNIEKACESFEVFQSRFACTWSEVEEVRELEKQLNRLKPITG